MLHAAGQTFIWIVVFFFASAGASSGYLTVSEIFPVEIRAEAIAVFFAIAQIFGALGTIFYGALIGNGTDRAGLTIGYLIGGGVMIIGGWSRSSSGSTPRASRWSRSHGRSPRSAPRPRETIAAGNRGAARDFADATTLVPGGSCS